MKSRLFLLGLVLAFFTACASAPPAPRSASGVRAARLGAQLLLGDRERAPGGLQLP